MNEWGFSLRTDKFETLITVEKGYFINDFFRTHDSIYLQIPWERKHLNVYEK